MKRFWEEIKSPKLKELRKTVAFVWLFSFAFYSLFYVFFDQIHNFYQPIDKTTIVYWQQFDIQRDGIEIQLVFLATLFSIFLVYLFSKNKTLNKIRLFSNIYFQALLVIPVVWYVVSIRSLLFSFVPNILVLFFPIGLTGFIYVMYIICFKKEKNISKYKTLFWILGFLFAFILVFSSGFISVYDYSFFVAPALKLMRGEPLGSFYIQYGLSGILVFIGMMALHLKVHEMGVIFLIILALYAYLFYLVGKKLIADRFLLFLFMVALVVIRFFAINNDLTEFPQALPFRLDLWVILLLCVVRFEFRSVVASIVFSLVYILESTFGFFYIACYGLFLIVSLFSENKKNLQKIFIVPNLILFIPIIISICFQLYFFHSIASPAAFYYQKLQLGFLSINAHSPYWLIFLFLPFAAYIFFKEHDKKRKEILLFVLFLSLFQLIYFYGRSFDNNLLTISGILLLVLFLTLDELKSIFALRLVPIIIGSTFIVISSTIFSGYIYKKINNVGKNLQKGTLAPYSNIDTFIDKNQHVVNLVPDKSKIYIISRVDSYINYRLGLKQIGFYSPFWINIYKDDTARFLKELIQKGYHLIVLDDLLEGIATDLNESKEVKNENLRFSLVNITGFQELVLEKNTVNKIKNNTNNLFKSHGLEFMYPQELTMNSLEKSVVLGNKEDNFSIEIFYPTKKSQMVSPEQYVTNTEQLGKFVGQGVALVPNFDFAYLKQWNKNNTIIYQFFLFKENSVVDLRIINLNEKNKTVVDNILGSLKM